jgi:hypothetical protein
MVVGFVHAMDQSMMFLAEFAGGLLLKILLFHPMNFLMSQLYALDKNNGK